MMCRVDAASSAEGKGGITCFLVPKGTKGLSFGANEKKMGWKVQPTRQVRKLRSLREEMCRSNFPAHYGRLLTSNRCSTAFESDNDDDGGFYIVDDGFYINVSTGHT